MIETENLTKKFGELTAVNNLTLHVNDGEVFGFLDPRDFFARNSLIRFFSQTFHLLLAVCICNKVKILINLQEENE